MCVKGFLFGGVCVHLPPPPVSHPVAWLWVSISGEFPPIALHGAWFRVTISFMHYYDFLLFVLLYTSLTKVAA